MSDLRGLNLILVIMNSLGPARYSEVHAEILKAVGRKVTRANRGYYASYFSRPGPFSPRNATQRYMHHHDGFPIYWTKVHGLYKISDEGLSRLKHANLLDIRI